LGEGFAEQAEFRHLSSMISGVFYSVPRFVL